MTENSCEGKKYSKYTREMRVELIRMVDEERMSTAHAARLLGIKQTSACRIMRSYHHHNRIFEKKTDKITRQRLQAQKSHQKDQTFSNKRAQQKKDESQNQEAPNAVSRLESGSGESASGTCLQNAERRGINYGGEGVGVLIQSIINFPADYYSIYYANVAPFTYGYLM